MLHMLPGTATAAVVTVTAALSCLFFLLPFIAGVDGLTSVSLDGADWTFRSVTGSQ